MTTAQSTTTYTQSLYAQADELDAKADALYMSLLAPSMKEQSLRAEAKRLRDLAKAEETARETEAARLAAEQLAREKADAAAREAELEAERKAARDARYAARKARGKKK